MTMTPEARAEKLAEMKASHIEAIERIEFALDLQKNSIVSHAWIVVYPNDIQTAYNFDVVAHPTEKGRKLATNPRIGCPARVVRFTKEDAISVASDCRDGNGKPLAVAHWADAAKLALAAHRSVIQWLDEAAASAA